MARPRGLKRAPRRRLQEAFEQNRLTLFVGAGVSVGSGLPDWRRFIGMLFLNSPRRRESDATLDVLDAAVAEWLFGQTRTSLDILGRQIRASYGRNDDEFLEGIRIALYYNSYLTWGEKTRPVAEVRRKILRGNHTLDAVLTLCRRTRPGRRGLRRVVSYNYDDLLEIMSRPRSTQPVWQPARIDPRTLPIFHVHGYVPAYGTRKSSRADDIILTEDQYNRVANDPYSWTNLVQLQAMTDSVGLVVGMSLDDRNLRRLLDATSSIAQRPELYAFVKNPPVPQMTAADIGKVKRFARRQAEELARRYPGEPPPLVDPGASATDGQLRRMIARHHKLDIARLTTMLDDLGIQPIWYDDVGEIAAFIKTIAV